ncbi:MAG: LemA family protein [Bacilli bacterium]|nr:LemA family protein [Bacilli bacterium]
MKGKNALLIGIGVIVLIVLILIVGTIKNYNEIVAREETVTKSLANVDTYLQRRADLIPNLVNTVKGYMSHEENIIAEITKARENLVGAKTIDEKSNANKKLTDAINNLYVVVENYPDLKASQNFISLQDEIAGSENRIATSRKDYNDSVNSYNAYIKRFPNNLVASMFGFTAKNYFEASEGSNDVPQVSFE